MINVFILDELEGVIPAKSNVRIKITFKPRECISYHDKNILLNEK